MDRIAITGANGSLGQRLIRHLVESCGVAREDILAVVRSNRAAARVESLPEPVRPEIAVVDYRDNKELAKAIQGRQRVVHLVGILKESAGAHYGDAHETASSSVAWAAEQTGGQRIVYASILGASPQSRNACLASKGRAERILLARSVPTTILRMPMVLGSDDPAAFALRGQAGSRIAMMVRGGASMEQPLDADDAVRALAAACLDPGSEDREHDLAGPESLSHRELVARCAAVLGRPAPRVIPVPLRFMRGLAGVLERILANPPITRAMLGVLEHDDQIDPLPAARALGIELTPLDVTLQRTLVGSAPTR